MIQSQKILLRFRYGPLMIRRNGSWVKSQLSDRGTTRIHIRLQWDTRVGYNVYELYCPLESIGQFGPSADPAIVAILYCCIVVNCIGCNKFLVNEYSIRYSSKNLYDKLIYEYLIYEYRDKSIFLFSINFYL